MGIREEYHKWQSSVTGKEFEMLVFGHAGYPVILFPTSRGRYYQNKDQGLIETARWFLERGIVKIYCPDSMDAWSWYNKAAPPGERAWHQHLYDRLVLEEVAGRGRHEKGRERNAGGGSG